MNYTKTVYKYPLKIAESQEVLMPEGAEILCIGYDPNGSLSLWALVECDKPQVPVPIFMCGTGTRVEAGAKYLETLKDGSFMWHFFTEADPDPACPGPSNLEKWETWEEGR